MLGAYLLEYALFPGPALSLRIEQGQEVRRPSVVLLRAGGVNGSYEVSVVKRRAAEHASDDVMIVPRSRPG